MRRKPEKPVEQQKLSVVLQKVYERRSDELRISPAWLATETMAELDPDKRAPEMVYHAAHLQLRQLAREICRGKWDINLEDENGPEQHQLFPDLQKRYPVAHGLNVEPEYVLLEDLEEADVRFNVQRMRRTSGKLQKHADALEAWWATRQSARAA